MAQAAWNLHPHAHARQKADVLLVTVTEMEAKAVLNLFPDHKACHLGPGAKTYYDLGLAADASVFMVQSEMGIGGAGGALLTVHEAISALSPSVVIMVGIAFGLKPKEQKVGDILVSTQICDYNQQKIDTSLGGQPVILTRGSRIPASASLLDRFRAGAKGWSCPASIHFGPILSGEKLINNQHYRDLLLGIEPEAIGGDMEGAALSTLGQLHKVDWVLVKAISDWADGEKDCQKRERQEEASSNAARFTTYVIRQGGFRKGDSGTEYIHHHHLLHSLRLSLSRERGSAPIPCTLTGCWRSPGSLGADILPPSAVGLLLMSGILRRPDRSKSTRATSTRASWRKRPFSRRFTTWSGLRLMRTSLPVAMAPPFTSGTPVQVGQRASIAAILACFQTFLPLPGRPMVNTLLRHVAAPVSTKLFISGI